MTIPEFTPPRDHRSLITGLQVRPLIINKTWVGQRGFHTIHLNHAGDPFRRTGGFPLVLQYPFPALAAARILLISGVIPLLVMRVVAAPNSAFLAGDRLGTPAIKAIVVDDDADLRELVREVLNQTPGCACTATFGSGEEAVDQIEHLKPNLILLDLKMPGLTGFELVRRFKRNLPTAKVAVITGLADAVRLLETALAGVNAFILKPFTIDDLSLAIPKIMAGEFYVSVHPWEESLDSLD